jgi:hypothetical protein
VKFSFSVYTIFLHYEAICYRPRFHEINIIKLTCSRGDNGIVMVVGIN